MERFAIEHRYDPRGLWSHGTGWAFRGRVDELEYRAVADVRKLRNRARARDRKYFPGRFHEYRIVKITREVVE